MGVLKQFRQKEIDLLHYAVRKRFALFNQQVLNFLTSDGCNLNITQIGLDMVQINAFVAVKTAVFDRVLLERVEPVICVIAEKYFLARSQTVCRLLFPIPQLAAYLSFG